MKFLSFLKVFVHYLDKIMSWLCYAALSFMLMITLLQVFARFVLDNPTSWSEEISLLFLVWFGMIGCGILVGQQGHIAITFFRDKLPLPAGRSLDIFAELMVLAFSVFLLIVSQDLIRIGQQQNLPASGLSRALLYWPLAIGGGLMSFGAFLNLCAFIGNSPLPQGHRLIGMEAVTVDEIEQKTEEDIRKQTGHG